MLCRCAGCNQSFLSFHTHGLQSPDSSRDLEVLPAKRSVLKSIVNIFRPSNEPQDSDSDSSSSSSSSSSPSRKPHVIIHFKQSSQHSLSSLAHAIYTPSLIVRLPDDVLARVFVHANASDTMGWLTALRISLVSRRWRVLAHAMPQLWTYIRVVTRPWAHEAVWWYQHLARNLPLTVQLEGGKVDGVVELLGDRVRRWDVLIRRGGEAYSVGPGVGGLRVGTVVLQGNASFLAQVHGMERLVVRENAVFDNATDLYALPILTKVLTLEAIPHNIDAFLASYVLPRLTTLEIVIPDGHGLLQDARRLLQALTGMIQRSGCTLKTLVLKNVAAETEGLLKLFRCTDSLKTLVIHGKIIADDLVRNLSVTFQHAETVLLPKLRALELVWDAGAEEDAVMDMAESRTSRLGASATGYKGLKSVVLRRRGGRRDFAKDGCL